MEPAEIREGVVRFVEEILEAIGLDLDVAADEQPECLSVELSGDGGEALLRRKGEGLDALQHVVNTAYRRYLPQNRRIVVDCMGFRRGKDAELREMARFLIERAKTSGVAQEIGPLNPYARRLVHLTVADDPGVTSESVGDAFMKPVVISPRKS